MRTGLARRHASYEQIHLLYMTLHDQRRISCRKDIYMGGTCTSVSKSERIVEFPFVQVEVLWLMAMLLTSSRYNSSLPGSLPSVVLGSSFRWAFVG